MNKVKILNLPLLTIYTCKHISTKMDHATLIYFFLPPKLFLLPVFEMHTRLPYSFSWQQNKILH